MTEMERPARRGPVILALIAGLTAAGHVGVHRQEKMLPA